MLHIATYSLNIKRILKLGERTAGNLFFSQNALLVLFNEQRARSLEVDSRAIVEPNFKRRAY